MIQDTPIRRAAYLCGGQTALAAILGVKPQAVQQWVAKGHVPPSRAIQIEQATSGQVTRHDLRPDLYPEKAAA